MKFTDGFWMTRKGYEMHYLQEIYRTSCGKDSLRLVALSTRSNGSRGAVLNCPAISVTFTSPMEDVIRVEMTHFAGAADHGPHFGIHSEPVKATAEDRGDTAVFTSGRLSVEADKAGADFRFMADGKVLTGTGFRSGGHVLEEKTGKTYMYEGLELGLGGLVYGLGERFGPYVKNGQQVDMWNADGGTASEQSYKNIPFYMTNLGYGIFVDDPGDVSFEVCSEKVERVQFSVEGEKLVYFVIYGPHPKAVLDRYTALTGRPALPPAWSFGLWLSTSFTTDYDEATTSSFIQGMADRDIPLSVFHFDCYWMRGLNWCDFEWDPDTFPDPEGMLRRYRERGLHLCCWINSYVAQESRLFEEGVKGGYFIKKEDGSVWQTDLWQAGMAILDVTNPEAVRWYSEKLEHLLDMGVDCLKTDFGERIPVRGIRYYDGSDPVRMHNYYTFLYNKMVFDLLEKKRGKGEAVLFARSATAGGQQFPVHWGGDCTATYMSMAETLRAGLSMAHSGFGFWSHDISGFEQTAPAEVYKRWAQFGLLSSHSRLHGSTSYRVPWLFDEEANDVVREFTRLKCRLMPYLFAKAVEAHEHGIPMMRPMMLEFPEDRTAQQCDMQYMLGDSLLAAPVFHASDVSYYLPAGHWVNLIDGHSLEGSRWVQEKYGFLSMPLMVREGSVIPMGAVDDRPDYDYTDGLELHVFGLKEGESRSVTVYDTKGLPAAEYTVTVSGGEAKVRTDSDKPFSVIIH